MAVIALTAENGVTYVPRHARVFNPAPALDGPLRIALAAAGFKSFDIVRSLDDRITTSLAVHPPIAASKRFGKRVALDIAYDNNVLNTLAPTYHVDIGSLNRLLPSTQWEVDGGAQVLVVQLNMIPYIEHVAQPTHPQSNTVRPKQTRGNKGSPSGAVLPLVLENVDNAVTVGLRRVLRIASVDGVALRDGDIVRDATAKKWYFFDGMLADAVQMYVMAKSLALTDSAGDQGRVLTARRRSSSAPNRYIADARYELIVHWPRSEGGGRTAFSAVSFPLGGSSAGATWGWTLDKQWATVEHPRGICQGPVGERLDKDTPMLCVSSGGTWDRPCETDTECPFYDSRRGRGGCRDSGFCEMPLGVNNLSYRKQGSTSDVMVVGCTHDDPDYPWCSDEPIDNVRFGRTPQH
jgi:hypothetical protein